MSLQSIAHNAGRLWFLYKKHKSLITVNIPAQLLNVRHVLVLMPENETEYRSTDKKLPVLDTLFPKADFVFLKLKSLPPINPATGATIEWEAADLDYWGLPNRAIKKRIFFRPFDLVLDLSLSFGFFNLVIAHHSLAPLKICFSHPQREDVFNFIISFSAQPSMEQAFNALRRCLAGK